MREVLVCSRSQDCLACNVDGPNTLCSITAASGLVNKWMSIGCKIYYHHKLLRKPRHCFTSKYLPYHSVRPSPFIFAIGRYNLTTVQAPETWLTPLAGP